MPPAQRQRQEYDAHRRCGILRKDGVVRGRREPDAKAHSAMCADGAAWSIVGGIGDRAPPGRELGSLGLKRLWSSMGEDIDTRVLVYMPAMQMAVWVGAVSMR